MLQKTIKNVSIISLAHLQIHLQYTNHKNLLYIQKISQHDNAKQIQIVMYMYMYM